MIAHNLVNVWFFGGYNYIFVWQACKAAQNWGTSPWCGISSAFRGLPTYVVSADPTICSCREKLCLLTHAGWWFGTFFIFHNMWDNPNPIDFHIFQRGWNHQPALVLGLFWTSCDSETSSLDSLCINMAWMLRVFPCLPVDDHILRLGYSTTNQGGYLLKNSWRLSRMFLLMSFILLILLYAPMWFIYITNYFRSLIPLYWLKSL